MCYAILDIKHRDPIEIALYNSNDNLISLKEY